MSHQVEAAVSAVPISTPGPARIVHWDMHFASTWVFSVMASPKSRAGRKA